MIKEKLENYVPDDEELEDAIYFMMNCSSEDLLDSWNRIGSEWDTESIVKIHGFLSQTNRLAILLESITEARDV